MSSASRFPLTIKVKPYLADHCFRENAVLPAVEAMQVLAQCVRNHFPGACVHTIKKASFNKFLTLSFGEEGSDVAAFADITQAENGDIEAVLLTRITLKSGGMRRSLVHASLVFSKDDPAGNGEMADWQIGSEPSVFEVSPERIYRELVPFGPAFRNITCPLAVSRAGAAGKVKAGPQKQEPDGFGLLGSSFPLDAAFHAACVWGQRYEGIIAFPVGFGKRTIVTITEPGGIYDVRVRPVALEGGVLVFDLRIEDGGGRLHETVEGLMMRDVSGGRMAPPAWIVDGGI